MLALVFAFVLAGCDESAPGSASRRPPPGPVPVVTVEALRQPIARSAESVGTLNGNESVTLTAKVTEQVSAVFFEGGEHVKAGQVLVELIDEEQLALLGEAEAKLEETRLQLERLLTLGSEIATAAEIDVARTRVDANTAFLEALRSRIADRSIRAPFDGIIGIRQISVGALLSPGSVVAQLDDIDLMKLDFTLPEHFISEVSVGDGVRARSAAWPDEIMYGEVTRIETRVDPVTRAFSVRAVLENSDGRLRPGMLMAVEIALASREGILVPETALLQSGAQSSVYLVDGDAKARRVPVKIGRRVPGAVEISDGVSSGDRVVISGQLTLRPGIAVVEAPAPSPVTPVSSQVAASAAAP